MAVFFGKRFTQFIFNVMNIFILVVYGQRRFPNPIKTYIGIRIHMKAI